MAEQTLKLTQQGAALGAKLMGLGERMQISGVGIGDGAEPPSAYLQTGLVHEVTRVYGGDIAITIIAHTVVQLDLRYDNEAVGGYTHRETCIYAIDPDDGEICFAYGHLRDMASPVPPADGATYVRRRYRIAMEWSDAENVVIEIANPLDQIVGVNIGPPESGAGAYSHRTLDNELAFRRFTPGAGISIAEQHETIRISLAIEPTSDGNCSIVGANGFKQLIAGYGIKLTETDAEIEIAQKTIMANLDLYVVKFNMGFESPPYFGSLNSCFNWLRTVQIAPGNIVTVHIEGDKFEHNAPVDLQHPQGGQIEIVGETVGTTTITTAGSISGNAPNYTVGFNVASSSGINVGDHIAIRGATQPDLNGVWKVTSVSGNVVNVAFTGRRPSMALTWTLNGATVTYFPTILSWYGSNNGNGLRIGKNGLAAIRNVLLCTDTALGTGIYLWETPANLTLEKVAISNFTRGINTRYSGIHVNFNEVYACSNGDAGIVCDNGSSVASSGIVAACGNSGNGIWLAHNATSNFNSSYVYACSNGAAGFSADGAYIRSEAGVVAFNNLYGVYSAYRGQFRAGGTLQTNNVNQNRTYDLCSANGGYITLSRNSTIGLLSSPAIGTLSGDGSYVYASTT